MNVTLTTTQKLDVALALQTAACAKALCVIEKKGHKVAEFLRDQVTFKQEKPPK